MDESLTAKFLAGEAKTNKLIHLPRYPQIMIKKKTIKNPGKVNGILNDWGACS